MMESICEAPGVVWEYLNTNGETTVAKLKKETGLKGDLVPMALGWLAREEKVNICKKGTSVKVSLV